MTDKKTTKTVKQAEKKPPTELTEEQLDGAQGGSVRMEQLNNKYPENMKHR